MAAPDPIVGSVCLEIHAAAVNAVMVFIGMIALLIASLVLTYSVFSRYLFKAATDWQDEVAVFSIVGAVFLAGAWVQAQRGHVGIEAVASTVKSGTFAFKAGATWPLPLPSEPWQAAQWARNKSGPFTE